MDGEFELSGFYKSRDETVMITRRYTKTSEPSQEGVGIPYDYEGKWDGMITFGAWHPRSYPFYGGEFEMWPEIEEEKLTISFEIEEFATATS